MSVIADRKKQTSSQTPKGKKAIHKIKKPTAKKATAKSKVVNTVGKLREKLQLTQPEFAGLLPASSRTVATLEQGVPPSETVGRRLTELERLTKALEEVIRSESIGKWLKTTNSAFGGLKPMEVIDRGESDRLWEMVYFLRSGVAS